MVGISFYSINFRTRDTFRNITGASTSLKHQALMPCRCNFHCCSTWANKQAHFVQAANCTKLQHSFNAKSIFTYHVSTISQTPPGHHSSWCVALYKTDKPLRYCCTTTLLAGRKCHLLSQPRQEALLGSLAVLQSGVHTSRFSSDTLTGNLDCRPWRSLFPPQQISKQWWDISATSILYSIPEKSTCLTHISVRLWNTEPNHFNRLTPLNKGILVYMHGSHIQKGLGGQALHKHFIF